MGTSGIQVDALTSGLGTLTAKLRAKGSNTIVDIALTEIDDSKSYVNESVTTAADKFYGWTCWDGMEYHRGNFYTDSDGNEITPTSAQDLSKVIEDNFADDMLDQNLKQQIVDKILENFPSMDELSIAALVNAMWDKILEGNHDIPGSAGRLIQIAAKTTGYGTGDVAVNHDTGGADTLAFKTVGGQGIEDATIRAFQKSDYDAGNFLSYDWTTTDENGRWNHPMFLKSNIEYVLRFNKAKEFKPVFVHITPELEEVI